MKRFSAVRLGLVTALATALIAVVPVPARAAPPGQPAAPELTAGPAYGYTLKTEGIPAFTIAISPTGTRSTVTRGSFQDTTPDMTQVLVSLPDPRRHNGRKYVFRVHHAKTRTTTTVGVGVAATLVDGAVALLNENGGIELRSFTGSLLRTLPAAWGEESIQTREARFGGPSVALLSASADGRYLYETVSTKKTQVIVRPIDTGAVWRRYDLPYVVPSSYCQVFTADRTTPLDVIMTCAYAAELGPGVRIRGIARGTVTKGNVSVVVAQPYSELNRLETTPVVIRHWGGDDSIWTEVVGVQEPIGGWATGGFGSTLFYGKNGALFKRDLLTQVDTRIATLSGREGDPGRGIRTIDGTW